MAKKQVVEEEIATPAEDVVICPALEKTIRTFVIRGTAPGLLCDRAPEGTPPSPDPRTDKQRYVDSLYALDPPEADSAFGFPATGIKKSMVRAGKMGKENMTDLRSLFFIITPRVDGLLPILKMEPKQVTHRARNSKKGHITVVRSFFAAGWEMELPIEYVAGKLDVPQIVSLIERAGYGVGIGAWRPENDGLYGRFEIVPD